MFCLSFVFVLNIILFVALELVTHGVALESIDEWIQAAQRPSTLAKLPKTFFQERVVRKRKAHIKGFAAECLSAIVMLGFFLQVVVAPMGIVQLQDNLDCFALLVCMVKLFQQADYTTIDSLRACLQTHHTLFRKCYPLCLKPKVHAAQHILDSWKFWGFLIDCFAPERTHKIYKRILRFSYREAYKTALHYALRMFFDALGDDTTFDPYYFVGPSLQVDNIQLNLEFFGIGKVMQWGLEMKTVIGNIKKGDCLEFEGSRNNIGFVIGFAKTLLLRDRKCIFVVALQACAPKPLPSRNWVRTTQKGFLCVDKLRRAIPWIDLGHEFMPACD
jgi:hypothetical protein